MQEEHEVTVERTPEEEAARLRYLEFVQQAAAQAVILAAAAYAYAKQGAGPLRPGVDHVEGTVRAVVGPVYDRYHAVPLDLLKFLDRKVRTYENTLAQTYSRDVLPGFNVKFRPLAFFGP